MEHESNVGLELEDKSVWTQSSVKSGMKVKDTL